MSTASNPDPGRPPRQTGLGAESVGFELAEAVAAFVTSFGRWARTLDTEDAPSYPRLRLLYTLHCEGPQRMADLADALEVTPRNVTSLVDGLEQEGLVRRRPHPTDRRATIVGLEPGAIDVDGLYRTRAAQIGELFANLGKGDREALLRIVRKLDTRLRQG
jgi:DNA-binding MarR family transcriptional regulator